jgi:hypothetical protein
MKSVRMLLPLYLTQYATARDSVNGTGPLLVTTRVKRALLVLLKVSAAVPRDRLAQLAVGVIVGVFVGVRVSVGGGVGVIVGVLVGVNVMVGNVSVPTLPGRTTSRDLRKDSTMPSRMACSRTLGHTLLKKGVIKGWRKVTIIFMRSPGPPGSSRKRKS